MMLTVLLSARLLPVAVKAKKALLPLLSAQVSEAVLFLTVSFSSAVTMQAVKSVTLLSSMTVMNVIAAESAVGKDTPLQLHL